MTEEDKLTVDDCDGTIGIVGTVGTVGTVGIDGTSARHGRNHRIREFLLSLPYYRWLSHTTIAEVTTTSRTTATTEAAIAA